MSGTIAGGRKTAKRNKELYGADWYVRIGRLGGQKGAKDGTIKGFAVATPEQRIEWGRKGGIISRRKGVNNK